MFLHTYIPSSVAFIAGPFTVYWYGLVLAVAMAASIALAMRLARRFDIDRETILDLSFWLIIGGLIGTRVYEIFLEWPYYVAHPASILKIWQGGLAIHGALIGGVVALLIFSYRRRIDFLKLAALCVPAVALGQAIGRWGNWFNQELFGLPTNLPWAIPIEPFYRPLEYIAFSYFHPTFLYESIACALICVILLFMIRARVRSATILGSYLIMYGIVRFALEYIKIDQTPLVFGMRWPQVMSLVLCMAGLLLGFWRRKK